MTKFETFSKYFHWGYGWGWVDLDVRENNQPDLNETRNQKSKQFLTATKLINETPWDNIRNWITASSWLKQQYNSKRPDVILFMCHRFNTLNFWARIGVTRLDSYDDCDNTAVGLSAINSKLRSSSFVPPISYRYL